MDEFDPIDVEIGRRVHDARLRAGLTQRELGESIGLTFQQVQKYEKGQSRMAVSTLCRIAKALGVPPAALVGELLGAAVSDIDLLAPHERELIAAFRSLPEGRPREALVAAVKSLSTVAGG